MPINADQRRPVPINADQLGTQISNALPMLLRARIVEAVAVAQAVEGGPVTSQQARAATAAPVLRHARAFTEVAARVAQLGPDERGRVLHAAGRDRKGFALWWVEERRAAGD